MTLNIDQLKKKIIYRSNYRGTKEMDKLLGAFTKKYIESLNVKDLKDLEELLDIDDTNLYNFYNGLDCDIKSKDNYIYTLFKDFRYNHD
jgi:antitoxin CptB